MILITDRKKLKLTSPSRTCGGDPTDKPYYPLNFESFPRELGDPKLEVAAKKSEGVLPTYAGVILKRVHRLVILPGPSRTRGGDPVLLEKTDSVLKSFPHMRG